MQIPELSEINKELCKREYYEFFKQSWNILNPFDNLVDNWHIKYLCNILQSEILRIVNYKPKLKDIIINIPPRSLKSSIVNIFLNAWAWTFAPHLKFLSASYSGDLAVEMAVKTRRLIDSDWYQEKWGEVVSFAQDQNVKSRFENTRGGSRKSTGVGGTITGAGGDVIIIDDPLNPLDAHSEVKRKEAITWFKETMYSRLDNQKIGIRIIIMQRVHEEDLTGWLLKTQPEKWEHICIPVTDDYEIKPKNLAKFYKDGFFFPGRFSQEVLNDSKKVMGSYGYAGQMGQRPAPEGGGIFKREWFKYYQELPKIKRKLWSWDTAAKAKEENCYTVGQLWGIGVEGFYLIDLIRKKMQYPELKRIILNAYESSPASGVLIEDKSSGQSVIQDLKNSTTLPILEIQPVKDKTTRAHLASPTVEAGKCFLPQGAEFIPDFLSELAIFPNGQFDDQVDSFTQFINYINSKQSQDLKTILSKIKVAGKRKY